MMICPALAVNKVISIPPEPLEHIRLDGSVIKIPVPTVHIGPQPLLVRLMSAVKREGMVCVVSILIILCIGYFKKIIHL